MSWGYWEWVGVRELELGVGMLVYWCISVLGEGEVLGEGGA